jgi:hypothetical protein
MATFDDPEHTRQLTKLRLCSEGSDAQATLEKVAEYSRVVCAGRDDDRREKEA